jgi:hypothetical protein
MRRPALRSMPRMMPTLLHTLLHTLLPSLVTRHLLPMPPTDSRRSSARMSAASPQSRVDVRVYQRPIMCRRSSRQCIARLIRLRSTLHPPPDSGDFASMILRTENCFTEMIATWRVQQNARRRARWGVRGVWGEWAQNCVIYAPAGIVENFVHWQG